MATGEYLGYFHPFDIETSVSNTPGLFFVSGVAKPVLAFDCSLNEKAMFAGVMPAHYGDGGIKAVIQFAGASTSTLVNFIGGWDHDVSVSSDSFGTLVTIGVSAPNLIGSYVYATIQFADGAETDNLAADNPYRFYLHRASLATNLQNDVYVRSIAIKEV